MSERKQTPVGRRVTNFKESFSGDYDVKRTPLQKVHTFCEADRPSLDVGWPSEGSPDKAVTARVHQVTVGSPGHREQAVVLTRPPWSRAYLEENRRFSLLARAAATSKCRPEGKKPILLSEPEDTPSPSTPTAPLPRAPEQPATPLQPLTAIHVKTAWNPLTPHPR